MNKVPPKVSPGTTRRRVEPTTVVVELGHHPSQATLNLGPSPPTTIALSSSHLSGPSGNISAMVVLRAMTDSDVPAVADAWDRAFQAMRAIYGLPALEVTPADELRLHNRIRHFLATDPDGSWVADDVGEIAGLSQSFVREGYWVLSLLATVPHFQRRGLGRELLQRAMTNADSHSPGSIQCSRDPAAMTLYASAGFSLHPAVIGWGTVRPGTVRVDPRVRHSDKRDLDTVDVVDRLVRGSARSVDITAMLNEPGNRLLLIDDRGYAVAKDDRIVTLGARDEFAATALLKTALAEMSEGAVVQVNWLTANQQWAIRTLVDCGVELHPRGPMMVRGMTGPPTPYIPSGGYG
jgi:GNAT superfamily N-acetyltransferase